MGPPKRGPYQKGATAYQKRSLHAVGKGPNKRTPLSYLDSYFGDAGKDVNFEVQNIIEQAQRNGSVIFKVVWKQLGAGFDNVEATWEVLENLKHMRIRASWRISSPSTIGARLEQEQAAKQDQRMMYLAMPQMPFHTTNVLEWWRGQRHIHLA